MSVPYGKQCRELFYVPDGYKLCGVDVSGLELRVLAHFLSKYDDGEYANEVIKGDVHTLNQQSAGLATRNLAKTFIYAFLYGAGDRRIAEITGGTVKEAKAVKEKFLKNTPAIARLRRDVLHTVEAKGFLRGIDGRVLTIRSPHSALNTLIQSAGALIVKQATVFLHEKIKNLDCNMVAHIHDEMQLQVKEDIAEYVDSKQFNPFKPPKAFNLDANLWRIQNRKQLGRRPINNQDRFAYYRLGEKYEDRFVQICQQYEIDAEINPEKKTILMLLI